MILSSLFQTRSTINVRQRIRQRGRILQYKQTHYFPKPPSYHALPVAVLGSGYLRRLVRANTDNAHQLIKQVDWQAFLSGVPKSKLSTTNLSPEPVRGVRWHPSGAWRVTFKKSDMYRNFFVNCSCYFRVTQHGFTEGRRKAIAYRQTLESEWQELQRTWRKLDQIQKPAPKLAETSST